MRQVLSFACAAGLVLAGGYIIFMNIAHGQGFYLRGLAMAATLLMVGAAWLWADFISPIILPTRKS